MWRGLPIGADGLEAEERIVVSGIQRVLFGIAVVPPEEPRDFAAAEAEAEAAQIEPPSPLHLATGRRDRAPCPDPADRRDLGPMPARDRLFGGRPAYRPGDRDPFEPSRKRSPPRRWGDRSTAWRECSRCVRTPPTTDATLTTTVELGTNVNEARPLERNRVAIAGPRLPKAIRASGCRRSRARLRSSSTCSRSIPPATSRRLSTASRTGSSVGCSRSTASARSPSSASGSIRCASGSTPPGSPRAI